MFGTKGLIITLKELHLAGTDIFPTSTLCFLAGDSSDLMRQSLNDLRLDLTLKSEEAACFGVSRVLISLRIFYDSYSSETTFHSCCFFFFKF